MADKVLRTPLQLTFGVLWFGVCFLLWRPVPLILSMSIRIITLTLGTLLYFAGLALYLWGTQTLGEMYKPASGFGVQLNVDHRLITCGPFAFVRHPMYLGLQMVAVGGLLIYWTLSCRPVQGLDAGVRHSELFGSRHSRPTRRAGIGSRVW
jgi:protein-S-isoprenylcysteine O-methyltransferase Ste14